MARQTSLQRHGRHRSAPQRTEVPPRSPMGTLTLRTALLASASVRLHRLEDRFLASPTPGSDRRHRPCDRPHTRSDRDRARGRTNRRRTAWRHAHQHRWTSWCVGWPARRAQRSRRSEPDLCRAAAARGRSRLPRIGSTHSIGRRGRRSHVVSRGSTLWGIAGHYGVSVSSHRGRERHLANPSRIFVGQRLVDPRCHGARLEPRSEGVRRAPSISAAAERVAGRHVVSRGSTLWESPGTTA